MLDTELSDHIEKKAHRDIFKTLSSIKEYREWLKTNIVVTDGTFRPGEGSYLKDVKSFGIVTSERH